MSTAQDHSAHTLVTQFNLQSRLYNNVLDGVTDAEANKRAGDTVNHFKWLAGHLLSVRYGFKDLAGLKVENPYGELFAHGKSISGDVAYPSLDEFRERWNSISGPIGAALANLSLEMLAGPAPVKLPVDDGTFGGYVAFLMHHEAYHLGQMGMLRKYLGKEAMSYS